MSTKHSTLSRRSFVKQSVSCGAYLAGLYALAPRAVEAAFKSKQDREPIAVEKWGRIEQLDDGIWAVISTPFGDGDFTTVSNGGIIQGDDGVLIVEAYMNPTGAQWVAEWAERLTQKWPTDLVISHYHGDHSAGASGFEKDDRPIRTWVTPTTNELVTESRSENPVDRETLGNVVELSEERSTTIDLGGRTVEVTPRMGHTNSDCSISIREPNITWAGDLYFNMMVPNYSDAHPVQLNDAVDAMKRDDTIYVPGHGAVAGAEDYEQYQAFLVAMRDEVKKHFDKGESIEEAADAFQLPEEYAEWYIFSPQVIPRLVTAWYREFQ